MADSKTLTAEALATEILKSRGEADLLRDALDQTGVSIAPLSLLAAAVAEYYDTCAAHGDLPASAEAFATQVATMSKAIALVEHKLMAQARERAETANTAAEFTDLPNGAFVVPGPVEPQ